MDSYETVRPEPSLHVRERRPIKMHLVPGGPMGQPHMQPHVVAVCFDPVDLVRSQDENATALPDKHTGRAACIGRGAQQAGHLVLKRSLRVSREKFSSALQGLAHSLFPEWFQQVV